MERKTLVDLGKIRKVLLASELPAIFTGIVKDIEEKGTKEGGQAINVTVAIETPKVHEMLVEGEMQKVNVAGRETAIMYRIPKALTGRGQGDLLLKCMREMGFTDTAKLMNHKVKFQRLSLRETIAPDLPASFHENARHYPVEILDKPSE